MKEAGENDLERCSVSSENARRADQVGNERFAVSAIPPGEQLSGQVIGVSDPEAIRVGKRRHLFVELEVCLGHGHPTMIRGCP